MPYGFARASGMRRTWKVVAVSAAALLAASTASIFSARNALAASSSLTVGQSLSVNQYLLSTNGGYELLMQGDGNLVLYSVCPPQFTSCPTNRALWSSGTHDTAGTIVFMQGDGNLVLYDIPTGHAIWSSGTGGHPNGAYHLDDQSDGNLVINGPSGALWWTGTWYANNTQSIANGTCWGDTSYGKVGSPPTCRNTWSGRATSIYFRAIDQFSGARPGWVAPAQAAVNAWNNVPGPQYYSFTPRANDTWVYIQAVTTITNPNTTGITFECNSNGCDASGSTPIVATWSVIELNQNSLPTDGTGNVVENTIAHESGHAMMLHHNVVDPSSIMWPVTDGARTVPDANDYGIGGYPRGCTNAGFGTACIYGD